VAALASVVAVVTIALAINAQLAREEAELRRVQAENLISFMLGDLRSRLEPLGQLEMLDAVGAQAMQYFTELGDKGSEMEVLARAMALRQIGEVRFHQGQLEEALVAFSESRDIAAALHEDYPAQERYLFELGQAEFWVGYVAWEQGRLADAGESMQIYMAHTRTLLERDPGKDDYRLELAYALGNLGAIARQTGDQELALQYFQDAIIATQPLADAAPEDTQLLMLMSDNWSWVGSTLLDLRQLAAAENAYAVGLGQAELAHRLSGSPVHHEQVSTMSHFLANAHLRRGDLESGREKLFTALAIWDMLVAHDPTNARWAWAQLRTQRQLAELAVVTGATDSDQALLDAAIAGHRALVEQEGTSVEFRRGLAMSLRAQAMADLRSGRTRAAVARATEAREVLLAGGPVPAAEGVTAIMIQDTLGLALAAAGDDAAARRAWQAGLDAMPPPGARRLDEDVLLCRLAAWLGREDEARETDRALRAVGYADPRLPLPSRDD
jgi:tetratricopeptide (TPR) repeat protein